MSVTFSAKNLCMANSLHNVIHRHFLEFSLFEMVYPEGKLKRARTMRHCDAAAFVQKPEKCHDVPPIR
jgi:hypothetical protein